jgi:histidine triad (HIT) family protein
MKQEGCVFCSIVSGEISSERLYQDDLVTAFRDIHPLAPTHVLIVTNKHLDSVNGAQESVEPDLGRLFTVAKRLAQQEGIAESGYRLIVNNGSDGGQVVPHLHMHLLGGHKMKHPIG